MPVRVLHVHIKETNEDFYFGSVKAIYERFISKELGIAYSSLINYFNMKNGLPFENYRCKITRAFIETVDSIRAEKAGQNPTTKK